MDQAKGRIKQAAGDLTDNDDLKREGKADETAGKVKGAVDKVADVIQTKTPDSVDDKVEMAAEKVKDVIESIDGDKPAE